METTKHTAGNWDINQEQNTVSQYRIYSTLDGRNVGWFDGDDESRAETEANAKLIAAAPILYNAAYSALQAIYAMPKKKQGFYQYLINDLLNAIQKADGTRI